MREALLQTLEDVSTLFPNLRVGQLISNVLKEGEDLFYIEDNVLRERLIDFCKELGNGTARPNQGSGGSPVHPDLHRSTRSEDNQLPGEVQASESR